MCMCEVMYYVLCSAMQAPGQGSLVRGPQTIAPFNDASPRIFRYLSWKILAANLVLNKKTLGHVVKYIQMDPDFATPNHPNRSPELNFGTWAKVYPLFQLASHTLSARLSFCAGVTECHLYWVHDWIHDELLARSLQPIRHCQSLSLQSPGALNDPAFTALFRELGNWPQLRRISLHLGAIY